MFTYRNEGNFLLYLITFYVEYCSVLEGNINLQNFVILSFYAIYLILGGLLGLEGKYITAIKKNMPAGIA